MDIGCSRIPAQHQQRPQLQRPVGSRLQSLDDEDNLSANSRSSCNFLPSHSSTLNSDSESNGVAVVSVRDMIKRYNTVAKTSKQLASGQRKSQHALPTAKSSHFGVNKFGSQTNVKQYVTQLQSGGEESTKSAPQTCRCCIARNKIESCCQKSRPRRGSVKSDPTANKCSADESNKPPAPADDNSRVNRCCNSEDYESLKEIVNNELKPVLSKESYCLKSVESIEDLSGQAIESSYQSKTTIAKTASGVRIIIDIFFDQEQSVSATDVIGSRVETDIPQSRILSEFQQQALSASTAQLART